MAESSEPQTQCFIPEYFSFPFLKSRTFISTKITGVMIKTWTADEIIPPIIGAAIGFITSA
ncbi:MAG TPA: hypothetical protein VEM32_08530, partial [Geobacteraceae bacterium]|nr:hypothetical protein [Geobacteraceae bacterium]